MSVIGLLLQETPISAVEDIFGYMIAFLTLMGIWNYVIGAFMVMIILAVTFRVIDAIGGGK